MFTISTCKNNFAAALVRTKSTSDDTLGSTSDKTTDTMYIHID